MMITPEPEARQEKGEKKASKIKNSRKAVPLDKFNIIYYNNSSSLRDGGVEFFLAG